MLVIFQKQLRAQEIAEKCNLPCLYVVDSAGGNLPRMSEVFPDKDHFGRIFFNITRLSYRGIPQISLVLGSCAGGGAYVPSMCDQSVISRDFYFVFLLDCLESILRTLFKFSLDGPFDFGIYNYLLMIQIW